MLFTNILSSPLSKIFASSLVRLSPLTIPLVLLLVWSLIVLGLVLSADPWIVLLAIAPLLFAVSIALLCFIAYRIDFYA